MPVKKHNLPVLPPCHSSGEPMMIRLLFAALFLLLAPLPIHAEPKLLEVKKIWDQGKHNAFTDLIRWKERWYCVFREADAHVGGNGKLRVLESVDGKTWEPVGLVVEEGI